MKTLSVLFLNNLSHSFKNTECLDFADYFSLSNKDMLIWYAIQASIKSSWFSRKIFIQNSNFAIITDRLSFMKL